mmetsp:Transcript_29820/g.65961  ORF Transcript_29820/g.65961 Transcript_29820/m.65961 type:complete len:106 (+) Transcript_29820:347-664(+)|eukprot:CAMPEP_0202895554 /NCGR_PEP_ID=MMETSP1392-20130828/4720_1 /ASSEMBLY_ACC=CAM_ASM_000868 /TAXON_ID=225041 /ORGANISM="Chlamydomonas chlamydogama, Strain SAG 11-48b" /LENGTH=105 /DNA_ID=CAMNT_0049580593 /DNA_START=429 /DNA_END=746 /DNA_ORIENTATION=-
MGLPVFECMQQLRIRDDKRSRSLDFQSRSSAALDVQWLEHNNTVCTGHVLYNITNIGLTTITTNITGPLRIKAPAAAGAYFVNPGGFLHSSNSGPGAGRGPGGGV